MLNNRVRSEFNVGTVVAVAADGSVSVQWDGFAGPIDGIEAASLEIVGMAEHVAEPVEYDDAFADNMETEPDYFRGGDDAEG